MNSPLLEKSMDFATQIVLFYEEFSKSKKDTTIAKQLLRSATSIGANINEAIYGNSKADFISKLHISLKETGESIYWLTLLKRTNLVIYDFDKLLSSYDKLVKAAEFTPKNVKNINDFDTFGEAAKWMEKNGWRNRFYDNVTRDIVDETIKNFQSFVQRLYTNESNIGDEVTRRMEALKRTSELENGDSNYYGTGNEHDLDSFEREGYEVTFDGENDEFEVDLEEDDV